MKALEIIVSTFKGVDRETTNYLNIILPLCLKEMNVDPERIKTNNKNIQIIF